MGTKRGFGKHFVRFFNVSQWIGVDYLSQTAKGVSQMARQLFTYRKPTYRETYQEAVARLKLTDQALARRKKTFLRMAIFYTVLAFCLLGYALFLGFSRQWVQYAMTLMLSLLVFSFAFKEHFWYVQMREQRLGLTLKQWLKATCRGRLRVDP